MFKSEITRVFFQEKTHYSLRETIGILFGILFPLWGQTNPQSAEPELDVLCLVLMLSLEQIYRIRCMGFASLLLKQTFTLFNCSADNIRSLRPSLEQLVWLINIFRIFTFTLEMFLTTNFHFPSSQRKK